MVDRKAELPVISISSKYSVDDLPSDEKCEECGGDTVPGETLWMGSGKFVKVKAERAPALRCVGKCRGAWLPPKVALDLVTQSLPIFYLFNDHEIARGFEQEKTRLEETISSQP